MNNKKFLVSLLTIISVLVLATTISAFSSDLTTNEVVKVDLMEVGFSSDVSVIAGDLISIKVYFDATQDASDVKIKAEIEGDKVDVSERTDSFDVEDGMRYDKRLNLEVPYELKDQLSEDITLSIKIWNGDYKSEEEFTLRVQRPSYNLDVKSVTVAQTIKTGETFPVDLVLKNIGYNDLDDLYVTAKITALGINSGKRFFGDLVSLEECDCENDEICDERCGSCMDEDDEDTVKGRIYLDVPYNVESGIYALEITVYNDDTTSEVMKQIVIKNDFSETVIKSGNELIIVNPTNKVRVYKIIPESPASVSDNVVVIPAGSSKTILVTPALDKECDVSVLEGDNLVSTITFEASEDGKISTITSPVIILTVILAIIFLVLLVVLIVLITKKPEKSEEFGESYY